MIHRERPKITYNKKRNENVVVVGLGHGHGTGTARALCSLRTYSTFS